MALREYPALGVSALAVMLMLGFLLFRHDPYSAMARILFDDYLALKRENPDPTISICFTQSSSRAAHVGTKTASWSSALAKMLSNSFYSC